MFRKSVKQKGKEAKQHSAEMVIIDRNKKAFISYNIERIREIISRLSPEKLELFHTIPFLIHVNGPDFPGYMDHPVSAFGIYSFHDSGFWIEALKNFRFREKEMQPHLAGTYIIKGLYLVGSIGSLIHSERSDVAYWVVVDEQKTIDIHFRLLKGKLAKISDWSLKEYNQRIRFIILKDEQIRRNAFSSGGETRPWVDHETIQKEEFYRTFVMIAGQVPVWAVLPSGLDDKEYQAYADIVMEKNGGSPADSVYVDFGNPCAIVKSECPGAILRHLCKAEYDPVTSFVGASLIASYYYRADEGLPCDHVKKKYTESQLTNAVTFPDAVVFERILQFYQKPSDGRIHDLIKKAIYLIGYRRTLTQEHDGEQPFARLLSKYVSQWEWKNDMTEHLNAFDKWPEKKKLAFDEMMIESISELYRDVVIRMTGRGQLLPTHPAELQMIKNKISALFQKKKNKVPICSAYLKTKADTGQLNILCRQDMERKNQWSCYDYAGADCQNDEAYPIYTADHPLQVAGWIIANDLSGNLEGAVIFEDCTGNPLSHVSELFEETHHFLFEPDNFSNTCFKKDPEFTRLFIAVNSKPGDELLEDASMLIQNSWREVFFTPLDIKHIENTMLQCYKIGKVISNFFQKTASRNLQYSVFHNNADDREYIYRTIEEFVTQFRHDAFGTFETNHAETNNHELEDSRPFLDTL